MGAATGPHSLGLCYTQRRYLYISLARFEGERDLILPAPSLMGGIPKQNQKLYMSHIALPSHVAKRRKIARTRLAGWVNGTNGHCSGLTMQHTTDKRFVHINCSNTRVKLPVGVGIN